MQSERRSFHCGSAIGHWSFFPFSSTYLVVALPPSHVDSSSTWFGIPGVIGVIVLRTENGNFDVNKADAIELISLTYYNRDAQSFPREWDPARVVRVDAGGRDKKFVGIVRLAVFKLQGWVSNLLPYVRFSPPGMRTGECYVGILTTYVRGVASKEEGGTTKLVRWI